MSDYTEVFVGIDTSKLRNAVAVAEAGRDGEIRYLGEINNTQAATRKLVAKLSKRYGKLNFCYEAGPTGYGLHRWLTELGQSNIVVAPSLIPRRPGDRVKTNRRDAQSLAKHLRAGELTAVWVPDEAHEAMRDLIRARDAAVRDLRARRQRLSSFLLRHSLSYPGKTAWTKTHGRWLAGLKFEHHAHRLVLEESLNAIEDASARIVRLEKAIAELAPNWSLTPLAEAFRAMRGFDFIAAASIVAEIGDFGRFAKPGPLMGFVGLTPSESSTGDSVVRGPITKAGNGRARRILIEAAWCYRYPARLGADKRARMEALPKAVRDIAWKAQTRLCARFRALTAKGKLKAVAVTAIARELAGFLWAIAREVPLAKAAG